MKPKSIIFAAIILCSVAIAQQDDTPRYWIEKGRTLFNKSTTPEKNYPEAQSCFDKAIELMPLCVEGKCDSTSCDKTACAEAWYRKGLCLADPRYEAQEYEKLGLYVYRPIEAEKCFDKALQVDPNYAEALSLKGFCYILNGHPADGLPILNRSLEINPRFDDAWCMKGTAFWSLEMNEDAVYCFKKAAEYNPSWSDPWDNMRTIYSEEGKIKEAANCDKMVRMTTSRPY